jgi:hypothetical protein
MGDPLLARSRRMPRGFQYRFLNNLSEPNWSMLASDLFPLQLPAQPRDTRVQMYDRRSWNVALSRPSRVQCRKNIVEFPTVIR